MLQPSPRLQSSTLGLVLVDDQEGAQALHGAMETGVAAEIVGHGRRGQHLGHEHRIMGVTVRRQRPADDHDVGDRPDIVHRRAEDAEAGQRVATAPLGKAIEMPAQLHDDALMSRVRRRHQLGLSVQQLPTLVVRAVRDPGPILGDAHPGFTPNRDCHG
ncbi:hypothetical protein ASF39_09270 [Methylobacterium sp. Leaf108]|nr:hypothetical protein ASF39_09270 [Methylobacterium sp. Leaf108]